MHKVRVFRDISHKVTPKKHRGGEGVMANTVVSAGERDSEREEIAIHRDIHSSAD